jgi:hypothetical protein
MNGESLIQQQYDIPQKHSRMGIASFIIALGQGLVTLLLIVLAGILASMGRQQENEAGFMILGLFFIVGIFDHLVGVVLGIAGAVQKSRKKVFAILGLVLNTLALLFVVLLIVIGLIAEQ